MSFEGYYQTICQNGHYNEIDWLAFEHGTILCDECHASLLWRGPRISTTNGTDDDYGQRIEMNPDAENKVPLPPTCTFCNKHTFKLTQYEGYPCCKSCNQ